MGPSKTNTDFKTAVWVGHGERRVREEWQGQNSTEGDDSTKISKGASLHSNPRATWAA